MSCWRRPRRSPGTPHFGESLVTDYVRCSLWPTPGRPLQPTPAPGAGPILVISTTNDPATPYAAGVDLADRLERGVLVTKVGEGHTAAFDGNPCIDQAVSTYLIALEVPEPGTRC
ncbi:MAG: alpha/beta hydrolase [Acidimicrobiales bacterium]